jgi:hypothetical protein
MMWRLIRKNRMAAALIAAAALMMPAWGSPPPYSSTRNAKLCGRAGLDRQPGTGLEIDWLGGCNRDKV